MLEFISKFHRSSITVSNPPPPPALLLARPGSFLRPSGAVAGAEPLRHDAFESHFAGVGENGRAVALYMLVEAQAKAGFGQHTSKRGLAHFQRITPHVIAVQFDEVEGVEEYALVSAVVTDEIKGRLRS